MSKQLVDEPILVDESNLGDVILNYRQIQKICFYCTNCGKLYNGVVGRGRKNLLCHSCNTKRISLERWGTTCSLHNPTVEKKVKDTMIKKYGVEYPAQNEKVRDKMKKTTKERYGVEHYSSSEDYIKKVHNTCMERYGVMHHSQLESEKQKKIETCMNHFGVPYSILDKDIKEKTFNTNVKKYGVPYPVMLNPNPHVGRFSFEKDGVKFDSKWEMAYYSYLKEKNINFVFQPKIIFEYIFEGKTHKYHPDFLVNGQLIEIKGDHFFKNDGTAQCPFDHEKDGLFQAKLECMIKNNVKILRESDLRDLGILLR